MTDEEYERIRSILVRTDALFGRVSNGFPPRPDRFHSLAVSWVVNAWINEPLRLRMTTLPGYWWNYLRVAKICLQRSEGIYHRAAKQCAYDWLHQSGADDAIKEAQCFIGRADVYSRKAKIVVEVGHTVRSKAMLCAAAGYRFILVPFRHRGERPKAIEILFSDECRAVAKEIFQANRKATSAQIVENPCDE